MINFAQAQYLFLIFLIPVFFVIQAVLLRLRRRKIRKFGDEKLVEQLMPSYSKSKVWVRLTLFSIGFFFFAIGLARPQIGARLKEQEIKGAEIIIAMDVSNSMLAEDYSPNRLDRAKLAVSRLVDKLRDDRIGLVIFAGTSFVQLPVTTDYVSAKMFLNSIDTGSIPIQGTAMGDAITTCIRSFSQQSDKSRAIILITDGENHEDDAVKAAAAAAEKGIHVNIVGMGDPKGSPIPVDGNNNYMKDKAGNVVITKLNEQMCQEIAAAGHGTYVRADNTNSALRALQKEIDKMNKSELDSKVYSEYDERFQTFAWIALILLLVDFMTLDRKNRIFKKVKLFS